MPITDLLERNSKLYGEEIALVEINPEIQEAPRVTWKEYELIQPTSSVPYRREITWSVFDEKANRVANMLLGRGISKGQKVAILLMNCLEWLPIYFGILKAGAIAVPLNFRYTADEIEYCVKLAEWTCCSSARSLLAVWRTLSPPSAAERLLFFVGDTCPSFAEDYHRATANCSSAAPKVLVDDEDDGGHLLLLRHHRLPQGHSPRATPALLQAARMEAIHHETTHEDVFLCIPPLYHTGAKMHWFGSLFTGSRAVLLKGNTPQAIFDAVSQERCTIVWLLVPWCQDILAALDRGDLKLEDYQLVPVAADAHRRPARAPLPHQALAELLPPPQVRHQLRPVRVHRPGLCPSGHGQHRQGGRHRRARLRLEGQDCGRAGPARVPQGEVGELCVKGPGVMVCYYHDPEATAAVLKDGWLHTGDMARQDEDGFYFLVDRKKDVIISGGENLYPVQIEDFLSAYPKIHDVAVIGLPDKRLGEIAAAIIQLKDGMTCTESEINQFCMDLPRYKRPRKIIFADVPRNPTGKIEKPKLREKYCGVRLVEAQAQG